jgi:putative hemolysin
VNQQAFGAFLRLSLFSALFALQFAATPVWAADPPAPATSESWAQCAFRYLGLNTTKKPRFEVVDGRLNLRVSDPDVYGIRVLDHLFWLMGRPVGIPELQRIYREATSDSRPDVNVFQKFADAMGVKVETNFAPPGEKPADNQVVIPPTGPLVIMVNHAMPGADAVSVMAEIMKVRPDVKIMMNPIFDGIPQFHEHGIVADPNHPESPVNAQAARQSMAHLKGGGALLIFPAGDFSIRRPGEPLSVDPAWQQGTARIAQKTGAQVLPIFVHGESSGVFQTVRAFNEGLSGPLTIREMATARGKTVKLTGGKAIPKEKLAEIKDPAELTSFLRGQVYALSGHSANAMSPKRAEAAIGSARPERDTSKFEPIAEGVPVDKLLAEMEGLKPEHFLLQEGEFKVFLAKGSEVPLLMQEIARERERTFRGVGEGTGKAIDTDKYDQYYRQLFVWDTKTNKLVGAYRLGLGHDILPTMGSKGFYNSEFFNIDGLLKKTGPDVMELGRSFVVPEYQGHRKALFLLWKGIGEFVVRNPNYQGFFGPVSMSQAYQPTSQQLLVEYLTAKHQPPEWKGLVTSGNPPTFETPLAPAEAQAIVRNTGDLRELSALVESIEPDGKSLPPLFRQYLKWDGIFLAFDKDASFGTTDGFIYVDMQKADQKAIGMFIGKENAEKYQAHGKKAKAEGETPTEGVPAAGGFGTGVKTSVGSVAPKGNVAPLGTKAGPDPASESRP